MLKKKDQRQTSLLSAGVEPPPYGLCFVNTRRYGYITILHAGSLRHSLPRDTSLPEGGFIWDIEETFPIPLSPLRGALPEGEPYVLCLVIPHFNPARFSGGYIPLKLVHHRQAFDRLRRVFLDGYHTYTGYVYDL